MTDEGFVSDVYIKRALKFNKLFTVKELNKLVNSISNKRIREGLKSYIDYSKGFE